MSSRTPSIGLIPYRPTTLTFARPTRLISLRPSRIECIGIGADALARVAADLADATIVRDTAQAALTAAQEDLDPAAVATAQATYDAALVEYNAALAVIALARASEDAAAVETEAEEDLAEASAENLSFDALIDDINTSGDEIRTLLVDVFLVNNFSDFLIYENGSFKTYSDIPYQGNSGNLVTFEAEDVYDMVNKIVLDVQDAIEDSYNTQVEVELTDLKNLTDALVASGIKHRF